MIYRREIDGLRALAVLPVILFHAGFHLFGGGYVGVDVFFVISGFLITSILLAEIDSGSFSILGFYERRARRILPALFVVMAVCLPFAWIWLMPDEMKSFADSLIAVSGFSSNILFWKESGYFETATELKPLLHTWSLAVEEQYYVFFPLLLMAAMRLGRRWTLALLMLAALLSLAVAQWGVKHNPNAAFYLLPTRGWELMIGAVIAFLPAQSAERPGLHKQLLSLAGLALITGAIFLLDKQTPFPGVYALLPTIGAGLIIYFATAETITGKLLGSKALVGIGLISYSAYLWHQPLFAFARLRTFDTAGPTLMATMALLSLLLAWLTWRYVERPFRDRRRISGARIFAFSVAGSLAFVAIGLAGHLTQGFPGRFDAATIAAITPAKTRFDEESKQVPFADERGLKHCQFGDPNGSRTFVLYGDSHAQAIFSELDRELRAKGIKGVFINNEICLIPDVFDSRVDSRPGDCKRVATYLYRYISTKADYVAVAMRWTFRLYPVPGEIDTLLFDNGEQGVETGDVPRTNYTLIDGKPSTLAEGKKQAITTFLDQVLATDKQVFLVYPAPESGWNVPRLNFHHLVVTDKLVGTISTSFDVYKKRNRFVDTVLDGVPDRTNLVRVKPADLLCNTFVPGRCVVQTDGIPLYFDDDHLSNAGARIVIGQIGKALPHAASVADAGLVAP
jgi:peptidoglycan/LPS O-acetylase OafA/YrhL